MTHRTDDASSLIYARVAGLAYILTIIIGVISANFVKAKLVVSGNDAATVKNIIENELLFRIGISGELIMYAGVVILSLALFVILKTVNKNLALLALLFRSVEFIVGSATVLMSFAVLVLLNGKDYSIVFEAEQLQALVGLFLNAGTAAFDIVLLFVGLGGVVFCYLFLVSKYVPRIWAAWGIITYLSMIVLALLSIILPNHPAMFRIILYAQGGLFELLFGFWLLFKGVNVEQWEKRTRESA